MGAVLAAIHFPTLPNSGVNVLDESTLHWVHVLILAKDSNKSLTCLFYKIFIVAETQVDESVSHKLQFICQKHIWWAKFHFFFYTILDCILVWVYCTENDSIYLILAE